MFKRITTGRAAIAPERPTMNASNDNNGTSKPRKTVGQRLDEVLDPFLKDRTRLQAQLREQKQLRAQLEQQMKDTQRDLDVVEQSMLQSLRESARQDPLLSAAFHLNAQAGGDTDSPAVADLPALNPLLKPEAEPARR
jgi:hypothetical protein